MAELVLIGEVVEAFWDQGRTRISEEIATRLAWRQPNGWLKDRACRAVLRALESEGYISLPPSMSSSRSLQYSLWTPRKQNEEVQAAIEESHPTLQLEAVKGGAEERRWNRLVAEHHYLGFKVAVGRTMKFLVFDGEGKGRRVLGAVALSEAAWAVEARDQLLKPLELSREDVANNSRFLILPHVRVKNLASRILSLVASVGVPAWEDYYHHRLRILETFVDVARFRGTSYRAANWIEVGRTKGYMKSGSQHRNSQGPKAIFLLPLDGSDRRRLLHAMAPSASS